MKREGYKNTSRASDIKSKSADADKLIRLLAEMDIIGSEDAAKRVIPGKNNELYITLENHKFNDAISKLSEHGFALISLFCEDNAADAGRTSKAHVKKAGMMQKFCLFYVFEKAESEKILVIRLNLENANAISIVSSFPSASWYEREITDGFGITFDGTCDTRRLFLHETYPKDFHPLLKSFKNRNMNDIFNKQFVGPYEFTHIKGEGVYQIPVGPVHAGIIEPGHFRFSVIGEKIYALEIRMFYKHRGIEKLFEGKDPCDAVNIAQAISGDESVANAVAFCMAVEHISQIIVPRKAEQLRVILLELERIYSHLGDIAGMITDVAAPVKASEFLILREKIMRLNSQLTGSRFSKDIIAVGGLHKDIDPSLLEGLRKFFTTFIKEFNEKLENIYSASLIIDRFETTGVIKHNLVVPLNITGPSARACGIMTDTRKDHPYGSYKGLYISPQIASGGDVLSRFNVKTLEILYSAKIIMELSKKFAGTKSTGGIMARYDIKDGHAISLIESPRGQSMHWVDIRDGKIYRCKIRTASFCNWQAIQHAVLGNIVPDFPLVNKSLNLSYAGTDL